MARPTSRPHGPNAKALLAGRDAAAAARRHGRVVPVTRSATDRPLQTALSSCAPRSGAPRQRVRPRRVARPAGRPLAHQWDPTLAVGADEPDVRAALGITQPPKTIVRRQRHDGPLEGAPRNDALRSRFAQRIPRLEQHLVAAQLRLQPVLPGRAHACPSARVGTVAGGQHDVHRAPVGVLCRHQRLRRAPSSIRRRAQAAPAPTTASVRTASRCSTTSLRS